MARRQPHQERPAHAAALVDAGGRSDRSAACGLARPLLREASFYITVGASLRLLLLARDLDTASCVVVVVLLLLLAPAKHLRRAARAVAAVRAARE